MKGLALAVLGIAGIARQEDPWSRAWSDLEALRGQGLSRNEALAHRARLEQAVQGAPDSPEADLLLLSLESLDGREVGAKALRLAALRPLPYTGIESWYLADLLPPGPERAGLIRSALTDPTPLARWQVILAWNVAIDEARALRLEKGALPIQLALHERYHDASTAQDLALTYKALDQGQAADQVLEEALPRETQAGRSDADLWETRGINALGFGDDGLARDYLGRALAAGSRGAALLLARLELMSNRVASARDGFRALILDTPPPDWAWRGWGTTLLPAAFAPPQTHTIASPQD